MPEGVTLASTTDLQSRITHYILAFVAVSGFEHEELIGQPHNLVRHPDMPPEAFRDMWATLGSGAPWSALMKNRQLKRAAPAWRCTTGAWCAPL